MKKQYQRRFIDPREQYRRWIDSRLRTISLSAVIAYLQSRGWTQVPPDRTGFLVFQEPLAVCGEQAPLYQFVPDAEDSDDYVQRMFEFLTGLAEIEDRQASEVIDDILRYADKEGNGITHSPSASSQAVPQ